MGANFVMTPDGDVIEVQATSENKPLPWDEFMKLKALANAGIAEIADLQMQAVSQTD